MTKGFSAYCVLVHPTFSAKVLAYLLILVYLCHDFCWERRHLVRGKHQPQIRTPAPQKSCIQIDNKLYHYERIYF